MPLHFFRSSKVGKNVVRRFIDRDLKKVPGGGRDVYNAIELIVTTPELDLKRTGKLEMVRDGVCEFKFEKMKDHWLRIFISYFPTQDDIVILHLVLKKTNQLDLADIAKAVSKFKLYKAELEERS